MWPVPLTRPPAIKERSLDLTTLALRNVWSEADKDRMKFMGKVVSSLLRIKERVDVRHGCPNASHVSDRSEPAL
jgi:hypothetical protein